jgi:phospholipase C
MADVVGAFVGSPSYRRGALFVIYDEWGGFFDHVRAAARARRPSERRPQ